MNDKTPKLYLSRRNLLALLSKLDRAANGEETHCAIIKYKKEDAPTYQQTMNQIMVAAVEDDEYYEALNRPAGMMVDADEKNLCAPSTGLDVFMDFP